MKIKCDKAGAGLRNARHIIQTRHVNMTRRQAVYMGQVPFSALYSHEPSQSPTALGGVPVSTLLYS